jgi:predicted RNA methylase
MQVAKALVPLFEAGRSIDAAALRTAMEQAFGASDTSGSWIWKDAYEAAEVAQILMLSRYGALMQRQVSAPRAFLTMIERLAGLAPSHTRRSEDSVRLQQFSTPLPLAAIVAQAAGFRDDDLVLEPSAGTGLLAIFAKIAGARLALNELAETRRALLGHLFPGAVVSDHDAASIDDRLDRSITPSVIVMNPPFSAANHVDGRFRQATSQHVLSALARLAPGGRLVVITGESFRPSTKSFQSTFQRIAQSADVVFSAAIDGKVFARHGTTIDTRLTVIDKRATGADEIASVESEAVYHPICATTADLLNAVLTHCPQRHSPSPCPTSTALSAPTASTRTNLQALRNAARKETRALAEERARHPFDDITTAPIDYLPKAWSQPDGTLQDTVYEAYDLQAIRIDGAAEHPTALVQSTAMASVPPPVPTYRPILPKNLVQDGLLSAPQLESVIYAGNAHETHLKGWFKRGEIEGQLMAAAEGDEGAFRLRKGWFLGDGTGCGKGRQVAGIILDNWLKGRRRAVWVSKSDKLIEDARRDWIALGGRESDIVPLSKFRQGSDIRLPEGILFVTYATLRSAEREGKASRLDQVTSWLSDGFDGVIAFDESHAMANAAGEKSDRGDKKASQQGLAGLALQNAAPDARVLYVSATGATVVGNLAYASRLGLWGTGDFPFVTRAEFVAAMEAGGIAAMEMISRDLKALGLYLARSLSYAGVEYEMLVHELSPAQVAIYDSYADAYQILCAAAHKICNREDAIMRRNAAPSLLFGEFRATSFTLFLLGSGSEGIEPGKQVRVTFPSCWSISRCRNPNLFERPSLGFEIGLGIVVGRVEADMPEPASDDGDIDARRDKVDSRRVPEAVWRHMLRAKRGCRIRRRRDVTRQLVPHARCPQGFAVTIGEDALIRRARLAFQQSF